MVLSKPRWNISAVFNWRTSASTAASIAGYCSLQARRVPSFAIARCTWPSDAAAAASLSKDRSFLSQPLPSSASMRLRTKLAPIGGALACKVSRGAATSGGNTPGTVATNCATFITGPRKFPRTRVRSAAFCADIALVPPSDRAAPRAATPAKPLETRAKRVILLAMPSSRSFMRYCRAVCALTDPSACSPPLLPDPRRKCFCRPFARCRKARP